ncbi:MAG TPA: class I SAM-dependent methyltransferase [Allosphingosinicella sp.]|jgi:SAM-dependent methyltransferase
MTEWNPMLTERMFKPGVDPQPLSHGIATVLPPDERPAGYDKIAGLYDLVVGNALYNRLVWGSWPSRYADAARSALETAAEGEVLDCACGSLCFTAGVYRTRRSDRLLLFDRSLGMLRRARRRLPNGRFLQGDALAMPFGDQVFETTMAWGLLHLFEAGSPLLPELRRVTAPGGRVFATGLALAGRSLGDRMLAQLHDRGEAAEPRRWEAMRDEFDRVFPESRADLQGNMLLLEGRVPERA